MNRYEQARKGLDIGSAGGVVRIRDGQTTWICTSAAYQAARAQLEAQSAIEDDVGAAEAYGQLCALVAAPVAVLDGTDKGSDEAIEAIIRKAVAEGLLNGSEPLARRFI